MITMRENDVLENMEKAQEAHFEELHSKELMNIGRNFTSKEQQDVCRVVSTRILEQELERRRDAADKIITEVINIVEDRKLNNLSDCEEFITKIREAVKA